MCQQMMNPAWREGRRAPAAARVGNPPPPRVSLPVWRCAQCGIDSPRLDDAA
jgi:hypothetical protein